MSADNQQERRESQVGLDKKVIPDSFERLGSITTSKQTELPRAIELAGYHFVWSSYIPPTTEALLHIERLPNGEYEVTGYRKK